MLVFSFFCCPDHLGGAVANLDFVDTKKKNLDTFPLPNANRSVVSAWESEGVGYYRQWRTLLKDVTNAVIASTFMRKGGHVVPWLEPSDYPTAAERDLLEFMSSYERAMNPDEFLAYFRNKRRLSWDRFILSIAESSGLICFPGGDVRQNIRPFSDQCFGMIEKNPIPVGVEITTGGCSEERKISSVLISRRKSFVQQCPRVASTTPSLRF